MCKYVKRVAEYLEGLHAQEVIMHFAVIHALLEGIDGCIQWQPQHLHALHD